MTATSTEPATTGVRIAQGGGVRFVENPDGVREVEARICSYGVGPDTYGTTWKPGWSSDGLRESAEHGQPIPMVFGHDEHNLANIVGSVAAADDRPDGLYVRMRMANFDEVPSARVAYSLLRDGHISGWSFKYSGGATIPDPQHRGALQFTRARLVHVSPVIDPSIPGTATTGVRSDEPQQQEEEMDAAEIRAAIAAGIAEGLRAAGVTPEPAPTPETLALSIAGALSAACSMFDARSADLPDGMTELGGLLTAASVASDELLDSLGVDTSEVRSATEQALTSAAGERATQYADPGYQADKQKRYPIDTAEHVRAAWSYIHQEKNRAFYTAEQLAEIEGRIKAAAKRVGVDISDDTSRSADGPAADEADADLAAELEAAKAKLARV